MMVYHHLLGCARREHRLHLIQSAGTVEVETEHKVSLAEGFLHLLRLFVISHDMLRARQPLQEVGHHVWNANLWLLAQRLQVTSPPKR